MVLPARPARGPVLNLKETSWSHEHPVAPSGTGDEQLEVDKTVFLCIWQGWHFSPSYHLRRSSAENFKLYIELDFCRPHGPVQIASGVRTPARCRGEVQHLNLHDQVGPPRDASGFSLNANMLTTPSARVPDFECWLKSNRPPRAGQGLIDNLSERYLTIKEISEPFTVYGLSTFA